MAAYLIAEMDITDAAGFEEYRAAAPATVQQYGGRYLARGGRIETLEGDGHAQRVVVVEFPTVEQAMRWYDSEEYRGPKAIRLRCSKGRLLLVEGV